MGHLNIARRTLQEVFQFQDFLNPRQERAINGILETRKKDIIISMASKDGKSLCFQLFGYLSGGLTVVFSPSIALINDQVSFLRDDLNLNVEAIDSSIFYDERVTIMNEIANGEGPRFLFLTPEMADRHEEYFMNLIERNLVSNFVVDEAHKIVDASDFRDFDVLGRLRSLSRDVTWMALTSSNRDILVQIKRELRMRQTYLFLSSHVRPNIFYDSIEDGRNPENSPAKFLEELGVGSDPHVGPSGIIFCRRVVDVHRTHHYLLLNGIQSLTYHGQMTLEERENNLAEWANGSVRVLIATGESLGFGVHNQMPSVTFVIHIGMPQNLRSFYHESSHAGNDIDQQGFSRVYLRTSFFDWLGREGREDFERYHNAPCKRQYLARFFDEIVEPCENKCDACTRTDQRN